MGQSVLAGNSTNSNKTKKSDKGDSSNDSGNSEADVPETPENDDVGTIIEGEVSDITDELNGVQNAESDDAADVSDTAINETGETGTDDLAEEVNQETEEFHNDVAPAVAAAPEPTKGSFVPLVFGGLIAGAIGFGASHLGVLDTKQTESTESATLDTSALDARVEELGAEIGTLSTDLAGLASDVAGMTPTDTGPLSERLDILTADLEALKNAPVPTLEGASIEVPNDLIARLETLEAGGPMDSSLNERLEALEADVTTGMSGLTERIALLEDRLTDLQMAQEKAAEQDPTGDMASDQLAVFQSELETLTSEATAQVEEAKARASAFEKEAADAAARAERQSAIAALTSAIEGGSPFNEELAFFDDPHKALTATADAGVPSVGDLQRDFPDAARAALSTTTVVPQDASAGDRLAAFLKRQTNARSLSPKEGDGTDAVLSRAEALVAEGDLEGSLKELSLLSDEAKDVLGPWMANAQTRIDALAALSELSAAEN